jgi:hypothetical protein
MSLINLRLLQQNRHKADTNRCPLFCRYWMKSGLNTTCGPRHTKSARFCGYGSWQHDRALHRPADDARQHAPEWRPRPRGLVPGLRSHRLTQRRQLRRSPARARIWPANDVYRLRLYRRRRAARLEWLSGAGDDDVRMKRSARPELNAAYFLGGL